MRNLLGVSGGRLVPPAGDRTPDAASRNWRRETDEAWRAIKRDYVTATGTDVA